MPNYHVLARTYRPQRFSDVIGQDSIVTTLKNALLSGRIAHAYLFCGPRGTGKTTLARIFAKALNCSHRADDSEPCNTCTSCKEISTATSLEVIEIDGASNRGIDDIRKVNETVIYSSRSGTYTIYIIDEVHMLTKEAFNALLKTLEEPPHNVAFFFATTEPHKVPATIMSRCQRYNLGRIATHDIAGALRSIATDTHVAVTDEALNMVAAIADGGLRDALSTFDQLISYADGEITAITVSELLGLMPHDVFFDLDDAAVKGDISAAFTIAADIFSRGKDIPYFIEELIKHYRTLLLIICCGEKALDGVVDAPRYLQTASLYNKECCIIILEFLADFSRDVKHMPSKQIALEIALMKIIRCYRTVSVEALIAKLSALEHDVLAASASRSNSAVSKPQNFHDTLAQFSAVELDGTITKKTIS